MRLCYGLLMHFHWMAIGQVLSMQQPSLMYISLSKMKNSMRNTNSVCSLTIYPSGGQMVVFHSSSVVMHEFPLPWVEERSERKGSRGRRFGQREKVEENRGYREGENERVNEGEYVRRERGRQSGRIRRKVSEAKRGRYLWFLSRIRRLGSVGVSWLQWYASEFQLNLYFVTLWSSVVIPHTSQLISQGVNFPMFRAAVVHLTLITQTDLTYRMQVSHHRSKLKLGFEKDGGPAAIFKFPLYTVRLHCDWWDACSGARSNERSQCSGIDMPGSVSQTQG